MKGQYKVASPGLRPLWEEAKLLARQLDRFEMRHTLRGGNKEADQLANDAMDKGTGRPAAGRPGSTPASGAVKKLSSPGANPQVFEGYVKGGVVHLLEGDLPDGTFVKVTPK
jgi:probable phosphoglycerate mutase